MAPAIGYAKDGFILDQGDAASLAGSANRLAKDPAAAAIFLKPDGKPYAHRRAARSSRTSPRRSRRISDKGPDAFYKGAIADAIVKASGAKGGILAKAGFRAICGARTRSR